MSHTTQRHHRRYLHDYLERINRHGLPGNVINTVYQAIPDSPGLRGKIVDR